MLISKAFTLVGACCLLLVSLNSYGHHVLGRPSYSLNEDSNTPPSMAIETQIGEYFVTYMVFPAFPKPNEPGRINLYVTRIDNGAVLDQPVSFSVRDDSWFDGSWFNNWFGGNADAEEIGTQAIDDGIFHQGFMFSESGQYIIRAYFEKNNEPYEIDFPLQIGSQRPIGAIGATVGFLMLLLIAVNIIQRKRISRSKFQQGQKKS